VSDQPATLLVCLNRRSQIAPILSENHTLCVNTLRAGSDQIADVFAGRTKVTMAGALPHRVVERIVDRRAVLTDAVVAFDCRVIEIKAVATHNVVFAGVCRGAARQARAGAGLSRAVVQAGVRRAFRPKSFQENIRANGTETQAWNVCAFRPLVTGRHAPGVRKQ